MLDPFTLAARFIWDRSRKWQPRTVILTPSQYREAKAVGGVDEWERQLRDRAAEQARTFFRKEETMDSRFNNPDLPLEPSPEECSSRAKIFENENRVGFATWYPQMGGYRGKAVVIFEKGWTEDKNGTRRGGCMDVLVWHDGEFPFRGESDPRPPVSLHHCDPSQFVQFGEWMGRVNEEYRAK